MNKFDFSALGLNVAEGARMPIVYPGAQAAARDEQGNIGYIELLSIDFDVGRALSKKAGDEMRQRVSGAYVEEPDPEKRNIETLAALTVGWHLVAPTGSVIDVPFSREAAIALYGATETAWLFRRAYAYVQTEANFTKRSQDA